ncbi:MAG: hypothetical protein JWP89_5160 [Schlesneria sp.]|nr:hypothetical protein [Schlesneria sp.]
MAGRAGAITSRENGSRSPGGLTQGLFRPYGSTSIVRKTLAAQSRRQCHPKNRSRDTIASSAEGFAVADSHPIVKEQSRRAGFRRR